MPLTLCYNLHPSDLYSLIKSTFHGHLGKTLAHWHAVRRQSRWPNAPTLLALLVYGEARGESDEGQRAIVDIVINRARRYHRPNIDDVILQPFQFNSMTQGDASLSQAHDEESTVIESHLSFAQTAFDQVYAGTWLQVIPTATLYCTKQGLANQLDRWIDGEGPYWDFSKIQPLRRIGRHIFFYERP